MSCGWLNAEGKKRSYDDVERVKFLFALHFFWLCPMDGRRLVLSRSCDGRGPGVRGMMVLLAGQAMAVAPLVCVTWL